MEKFLSCDWGTSSFRLRLVNAHTAHVVRGEKNQKGIAAIYTLWKQANANIETRLSFYLSVINEAISEFENKLGISLDDVPLVISGMASASIGMMELPYAMLPFPVDGSGPVVQIINRNEEIARPIYIVSGARSENDVMRGEETQLVGAIQSPSREKQLFIFPGTHSKHVTVENNQAVSIKTYMTGEIFELLAEKSVLAHSIEEATGLEHTSNQNAFEKGVRHSMEHDLLHHAFLVRTNDLFSLATKQENHYYLSGLLIGSELNRLNNSDYPIITLVSDKKLHELYAIALKIKGFDNVQYYDAAEALVRGQLLILHAS
ncbi:MAG: 2-dehydro-3-deoxygalactonokinase [Chitinophagaceae bacterium]|nr:2-dehydro-3-deoxygalactonokinase [Chitinophagaceae bacterium]